MDKEHFCLEEIQRKIKQEGLNPGASAEENLRILWTLYQGTQLKLQSATNSLDQLKLQQAEEMKEVESYVAHIRSLTEEREELTTDFEKENIQLRIDLEKLQFQQESQLKEVEEMLEQEGLSEISQSSPSEQVAYLLVERATLLEKLDILEQKLDSHLESLSGIKRQDELEQIHQTLEEELYQQHESMKRTKETLNKEQLSSIQNPWKKLFGIRKMSANCSTFDEELNKEKKMRECVERDLNEAAQRLQMAHDEIRRLTDDLLIKKKEATELEHILQERQKEIETLHENEQSELQKAKEYNNRLDTENLALRNRVRFLDSERKKYMEQSEKSDSESRGTMLTSQNDQDNELLHKRCQLEIEQRESTIKELVYLQQKLQREHDETVERNEELESILGETQNQTKEQIHYLECEIEGLQRRIKLFEEELVRQPERKKELSAIDGSANTGSETSTGFLQMIENNEEKVKDLESKLTEEREQRVKLALDLKTAQKTVQAEKEACTSELQKLQAEMKNLENAKSENKMLHLQNEKLGEENSLHQRKMLDLTEECRRLQTALDEEKSLKEMLAAKEQMFQESGKIKENMQSEAEEMGVKLLESRKKCELLQKQIYEDTKEKQNLWSENLLLKGEIKILRQELRVKREEISTIKQEMSDVQNNSSMSQSLLDGGEEAIRTSLAGDALIQQQNEEIRQLRQDLHRVQHVCTSAEKELRYEREKNLDLKKQHMMLQQENIKINGELNQVKQKIPDITATCSSLEEDLDKKRQKVKELELELMKQSQTYKLYNNWQEKFEKEKNRALDAEKQVLELQHQLRASKHQLLLMETQVTERKHLEDELKNARESETKLRTQLQDNQLKVKLLDQRLDDLKQQIKVLRDKENVLVQNNSALQFKLHQQESRLQALDDEHNAAAKERVYCENNIQKLSAELSQIQLENERMHKEYNNVFKQLDEYIRKYNEKQLRHKTKLYQAKEVNVNEVNKRDMRIRELEMEISLAKCQTEKGKERISLITTENHRLHEEKRHLLEKVNEYEAMQSDNKLQLLTAQKRANILDKENKQLLETLFHLYNQIGPLERVIKKIQALNLEVSVSLDCTLPLHWSPKTHFYLCLC
ncbi:coiled-coil domain-containing protein 30 [Bombina bombina]|uniref:coiled-coil domain-containing protein 30 n=1 Tax=Bombina bombina TaxID=8345 RepID=UPI00235B0FA8|nr:coiled-coil domain-containing protein 30 [Bombina bombina]